jgi:predicted nucleic acid-binding protein
MESAHVGLILDSSVVIAGERRGHTVQQILQQFRSDYGETEIGVSVVTIVELIHGVQRAGTEDAGDAAKPSWTNSSAMCR